MRLIHKRKTLKWLWLWPPPRLRLQARSHTHTHPSDSHTHFSQTLTSPRYRRQAGLAHALRSASDRRCATDSRPHRAKDSKRDSHTHTDSPLTLTVTALQTAGEVTHTHFSLAPAAALKPQRERSHTDRAEDSKRGHAQALLWPQPRYKLQARLTHIQTPSTAVLKTHARLHAGSPLSDSDHRRAKYQKIKKIERLVKPSKFKRNRDRGKKPEYLSRNINHYYCDKLLWEWNLLEIYLIYRGALLS